MRVSGNGKRQPRTPINKNLDEKINRGMADVNNTERDYSSEKSNRMKSEIEKNNLETEKKEIEIEKTELETEKKNLEVEKKKSETKKKKLDKEKNKNRKRKKKELVIKPIGKLKGGKICGMLFVGLLSSGIITGVSYGLYNTFILNPPEEKRDIENSGLGAIQRWESSLSDFSNLGEKSYLAKEITYANGNEDKIAFIEKVIGTVSYEPLKVEAKDIYGNTKYERNSDVVVYVDSLINEPSEELILHFIDYSKLEFDEEKIKSILEDMGITSETPDYSNRLVDVFCRYISSLEDEDIPLVDKKVESNIDNINGVYTIGVEEDEILDKYLFSSDEFYQCLEDFSVVASRGMVNPDWIKWNVLSDEDKKAKGEPTKTIEELQPLADWNNWNALDEAKKKETKEPIKYDKNYIMNMRWCGSYVLMNGFDGNEESIILPEVGDGSIDNPAGLITGVVTSVLVTNANKERVAKPIKVKLTDYKVSQEALDYFNSKDLRNRGIDIKSEVQYASYTFEVTNLSNEVITIVDNSGLSDSSGNISAKTGTVYGLKNSVTLQPYETGVIESWSNSVELNKKYLVWGADFKREEPVVWFRVLMGNLEDTSEDKGVNLNGVKEDREEETSEEEVLEETNSEENKE